MQESGRHRLESQSTARWCVYPPVCPGRRSPAPRPPPSPPAPPCPGPAAADRTVSARERAFACLRAVTDLVDGFVAGVLQAQVDHGVLQRPAHVELQGQIVHPLEENAPLHCKFTQTLSAENHFLLENRAVFFGINVSGSLSLICTSLIKMSLFKICGHEKLARKLCVGISRPFCASSERHWSVFMFVFFTFGSAS